MVRRKHRRLKRNKNKKQVRLVLGISFCLLLIMTAGYAAFSTNIGINAKGNIKKLKAADMLKKKVVTTGDGLYADTYENGRYIYRGADPDNYITFNNEEAGWRIYSVENDGTIKIIKEELLTERAFDTIGNNGRRTSGYCLSEGAGDNLTNTIGNGCNAWTQIDSFTNGIYSGNVSENSALNLYLNGTSSSDYYYALTDVAKQQIQNHKWYIGGAWVPSTNETTSMATIIDREKVNFWEGNIALLTASEFARANTNIALCGTLESLLNNGEECQKTNYLSTSLTSAWWLLSPVYGYKTRELCASISVANSLCKVTFKVRPVLYLKHDITLSGQGTQQNPYTID